MTSGAAFVVDAASAGQKRAATLARYEGYVFPVGVFLITRLLLGLLAERAPSILASPHIAANRSYLPHSAAPSWLYSWLAPWFRFDARWYVDVAQHGYRYGAVTHTNTNFMPLYPALIKLLTMLTSLNAWLAAILVANMCFLAALCVLWKWSLKVLDSEPAQRALLLVAAFPFAFFFAAPYAEPVFLLFAVGAFLAAEEDRWTLAAVLAGVSTISRPVGIAVVLGITIMAFSRSQRREALLATLGVIPLALFSVYLGVAFGHPLAFTVYHTYGWVPPHGGIWGTISEQFHTKLSPFDRIDAAVAAVFIASGIAVWRRFGPGYGVYVLLGVLLPLSRGLAGMERYVIVLFPVMALWATWASKRGQVAIFAASALMLFLATTMFAAGYSLF